MTTPTNKTFTVAFRAGKPEDFAWLRSKPLASKCEANACADQYRLAGCPALVFLTRDLDACGLPEGFEVNAKAWGAYAPKGGAV